MEHGADLNRYYSPSWVRRGAPTAVSGRGGLFVSFLKKRCPASGTPFYSEQVIYYPDITFLKIAVRLRCHNSGMSMIHHNPIPRS